MSTPRHLPTGGPRRMAGRRALTTEAGRRIKDRERKRLAREQAHVAEEIVEDYRDRKRRREQAVADANSDDRRMERAIDKGFVRRLHGVMASEGLDVVVQSEPVHGDKSSAYCAFGEANGLDKIVLRYATFEDEHGRPDYRMMAANLRGLAYHEAGHARWTIPFRDLMRAVHGADTNRYDHLHPAWNILEDQRMETAVVSDSPRKAAYFLPMVMEHNCSDVNMLAANWPLLIWRKYLPAKVRQQGRQMFLMAHPKVTEQIADEIEATVQSYVMAQDEQTMYDALVRFHDLYVTHISPTLPTDDSHAVGRSRNAPQPDDDMLLIPIDPDMLQDDEAYVDDEGDFDDYDDDEWDDDEWDDDEDFDLTLDDLSEEDVEHVLDVIRRAFQCPWTLVRVGYYDPTAPPAEEENDDDLFTSSDAPSDPQDDEQDDSEAQDDQSNDDKGKSSADDANSDEDEGNSDEGDAKSEQDDESDPGEGAGSEEGDHSGEDELTDDDLSDMLQEAQDERNDDHLLNDDERSMREAESQVGTGLDNYDEGHMADADRLVQADNLAREVEQAFHCATTALAPQWVEEQKRGVLNVNRYATREPGQTDFFRQWTDDEGMGFDMSVSVLLDYSWSMMSETPDLSVVGYACKNAGERLEIPTTITLWDTHAKVLWDAYDRAEELPQITAAGGTNPRVALQDLFLQRHDKRQHIVIIFSDGTWQGCNEPNALNDYKEDGTYVVAIVYGQASSEHNVETLRAAGCDEVQRVDDLMQIPLVMERALSEAALMVR